MKFEFAPLDMNVLVRALSDFFSEELDRAGITLTLDLAGTLPLIQADERFMRQMLINLVKNAMSAMSSGGILHISTRSSEELVIMTVEDTGTGISEDMIHKIFEPYFTTKVDGTGLGLTMAYKVVKEHGGDIRVQSERGQGTCFTISLPVMRRAQKMIEYEEYKQK
jgi:signal transduction histidine kinase